MVHSAIRTKICLGITQSNFGGAQRHVFDLAKALSKRFDVAVIHGGSGVLAKKLDEEHITRHRLRSLERHMNPWGEVQSFFELVGLLRTEKPDVFHVHSSKMGFIGALAGRVAGVPRIVFTAHGWEFNAPRPWYQKALIYVLSLGIVFFAHRTIAISASIRDQMPAILRTKITVVHHGIERVSLLEKSEARAFLKSLAPLLGDGIWIGTIAELHPVKGIPHAIRAIQTTLETHPEAHYIVIGEGDERPALRALIEKEGLQSNVHLVGFVADAARYLSAFDIFVLPSVSEALGYAILEAGSASFPVIVSNVGGVPEIIEHGVHGTLVPPRDSVSIATAIAELITDRELGERYGAALRERVKEKFSLDRMVEQTVAEYCLTEN